MTSWLVRNWNTFGAQTSHGQTQTHKIQHNPDLGEATTFPFIVFFVLNHGANTQMSFCPETLGSPKIYQNWDSHNFGGLHMCVQTLRLRWIWSKVVVLIKSFPTVCGMPAARNEVKAILDF
jgi:hypothetical protein